MGGATERAAFVEEAPVVVGRVKFHSNGLGTALDGATVVSGVGVTFVSVAPAVEGVFKTEKAKGEASDGLGKGWAKGLGKDVELGIGGKTKGDGLESSFIAGLIASENNVGDGLGFDGEDGFGFGGEDIFGFGGEDIFDFGSADSWWVSLDGGPFWGVFVAISPRCLV